MRGAFVNCQYSCKNIIVYLQTLRAKFLVSDLGFVSALNSSGSRPTWFFLSCIVFCCAYLLAVQPGWVLSGEMWAEMATNYFPNAQSASLSKKFLSTDAGYIPLPQRLIAFVGSRLQASAVPYFYTWSAIVLTGIMIGTFCLRPFRVVIKSDALRFFTAISLLLIADYETTTFVNFTYFAAFFTAIITALALADDSNEVPWWSWFVPVLMVSKPAVLAILPAMMLVALVSKPRFRLIAFAAFLLAMMQIIRMVLSYSAGERLGNPVLGYDFGLIDKIYIAIKYFIGFVGAYIAGKTGKALSPELYRPGLFILFGLFVLATTFFVFRKRKPHNALIFVGLSLLFFNIFLNVFMLSTMWNADMVMLSNVPVYRHIIVGFIGIVMVVTGLIAAMTEAKGLSYVRVNNLGPVLFIIWFLGSGWGISRPVFHKVFDFPIAHNSQWQNMSDAIDSGEAVCVPIDPVGWIYQRNCSQLNAEQDAVQWHRNLKFSSLETVENTSFLTVLPPSSALEKNVSSIAVLAKTKTMNMIYVNAKAIVKMKDGTSAYLFGGRQLSLAGGLLMVSMRGMIPVKNIQSVTLSFDSQIEIGLVEDKASRTPAIIWMGS